MAINRQTVFAALKARLETIQGLTVGVRAKHWTDVSPSEQPALFVVAGSQRSDAQPGLPPRWTLKVDLFLYVHDTAPEGPASGLQENLDAIEAALEATPGELRASDARFRAQGQHFTTLGGLVAACRISGEVETDEGALGDQAVAIIPLEIVTA